MEIRHNFTLLCETAIPAIDGKISPINPFQNIEVVDFPAGITLTILFQLGGEGTGRYRAYLDFPAGDRLNFSDNRYEPNRNPANPFDIPAVTVATRFAPFVMSEPGVYHVTVELDGQVLSRYPFSVFKGPAKPNEEQNGTRDDLPG